MRPFNGITTSKLQNAMHQNRTEPKTEYKQISSKGSKTQVQVSTDGGVVGLGFLVMAQGAGGVMSAYR